jgi:hypothetical protein
VTTNPSEKYYEALRLTQQHHDNQTKTFSGNFTWKNRERIKYIIDRFEIKSILDYGCGRGRQYDRVDEETGQSLEQYWGGVAVTKYDPGVRWFSEEPQGKFDLVICVQVLGSIPRVDLPWVVDRLYGFANKVVYVAERLVIPGKQIYKKIEDDMPYGLSRGEWLEILRRPESGIHLFTALKSAEFKSGWFRYLEEHH